MEKPFWSRGCNWDINDKNPSPVDGYYNMSHWTRDLTAIRYAVPFFVKWPDKIDQMLDSSIKICKSQPRPYVDMLYEMKEKLKTMTLLEVAEEYYSYPHSNIRQQMGREILRLSSSDGL